MTEIGWLTRTLADVPADDRWLSDGEREVLAGLRVAKRRAEWRLGRWAAKAALIAACVGRPGEVEVIAAEDGAPEAFAGGEPMRVALSLSHRAGRALVAVREGSRALGADLEPVEPRSEAFVRQWLADTERELLEAGPAELRDLAANLVWVAKEAAAKARREGLRLDVRKARVGVGGVAVSAGSWEPLRVDWEDGTQIRGWWRHEPGWVMCVVSEPPSSHPRRLDD